MTQLNYHHPWRWGIPLLISGFIFGCSDEIYHFRPDDGNAGLRLELHAEIDQVNDTRADESGFADGDRFGVFVVNYKDGKPGNLSLSGNQANNVAFAYSSKENKWTAATDIYWQDDVTPADIYGYYPFNNGLGDVEAYRFEVQSDQSIPAADGDMGSYEASDFLWAKASGAKPGEKVDLTFSHILAGVKVILKPGSGYSEEEWSKLSRLVTVDNTVRTANIDLASGKAAPKGSFDRNIKMNPESDCYRAVVVPQTVAAGKSTIGITIDGVTNNFTRDGGMTYTAGKLHLFTLEVSRNGNNGDFSLSLVDEDIIAWETDQSSHDFESNSYLVVDVPKEGTLKSCLTALGADYSVVRNLKITGRLTEEDFTFMHDEMPQLNSLNIRSVKIVHISNWYIDKPAVHYVDNKIPNDAFEDTNLHRIILPDNIEILGRDCFCYLTFSSSLIIPNSVKEIQVSAFEQTKGDFEIVLPDKPEMIEGGAFFRTSASIELKLPHSLKYIGSSAFADSPNVYGTFSLPPDLEYIGDDAFRNCGTDLEGEIVIPTKIKVIPSCAFSINFKKPTTVTFHEGVTQIEHVAFAGLSFAAPIIFPKGLTSIGQNAFSGCRFVGDLKLPDGLAKIGLGAFKKTNIKGTFEIPAGIESLDESVFSNTYISSLKIGDNVDQIWEECFKSCEELRYIEIGKNITYIGPRAFVGCPGIETIVCLAKEPPSLDESSFQDVDFSHCVVEVPEKSVEAYRRAPSWSRFRSITPHHELSLSLSEFSCLNKGGNRECMLRAEGKWEIAEIPSWIHVTPDHADYKEVISVRIDPLPLGQGDREGRIVFRLKDNGYTNYMTVRQYDYQYEEDKEIVLQSASGKGNPIPVFIVGEGYGAESIVNGAYMQRVSETMEHLFAIEPFKSYRNMFTVSTAIALSPDDGAPDALSANQSKFSFMFPSLSGSDNIDNLKHYVDDMSVKFDYEDISRSLIIVLSNYDSFAGSSYQSWGEDTSIACIGISHDVYPYDNRGLVQKIVGGEAFGGLATEEICHNEFIKGCTCPFCNDLSTYYSKKSRGLFENVSISGKMADAPWKDFIFHEKYSSLVDMYEGGFRHLRGVWRSERESVMSTYIPYYNTISRYAIYKQIMRRAGLPYSIEDFIANDKIEFPQ